MSWTPKDPDEIEFFGWDFVDQLAPGDSLATIVGNFEDEGDGALPITGLGIVGTKVTGRWAAGTDGVKYILRCEVDTTQGERLTCTGVLHVQRPRLN